MLSFWDNGKLNIKFRLSFSPLRSNYFKKVIHGAPTVAGSFMVIKTMLIMQKESTTSPLKNWIAKVVKTEKAMNDAFKKFEDEAEKYNKSANSLDRHEAKRLLALVKIEKFKYKIKKFEHKLASLDLKKAQKAHKAAEKAAKKIVAAQKPTTPKKTAAEAAPKKAVRKKTAE
jgi:hypothetical protein